MFGVFSSSKETGAPPSERAELEVVEPASPSRSPRSKSPRPEPELERELEHTSWTGGWRWPTYSPEPDPNSGSPAAGYADMRKNGYTAKELRILGFSTRQMLQGGYDPRLIEATDGRSVRKLRAAQFTAKELKESGGFTIDELKSGGIKAADLRALGSTVKELRAYSVRQLREAGYTSLEMKLSLLHTLGELRSGGYPVADLLTADYTAGELKSVGFPLKELKEGGCEGSALRLAGFDAAAMIGVGYSVAELYSSEYPAAAVVKAGCKLAEIKEAGYRAKALREAGVSVAALKAVGYHVQELLEGGCSTIKQLLEAGFSRNDMADQGVDLDDMFGGLVGVDATRQYKAAGESRRDGPAVVARPWLRPGPVLLHIAAHECLIMPRVARSIPCTQASRRRDCARSWARATSRSAMSSTAATR